MSNVKKYKELRVLIDTLGAEINEHTEAWAKEISPHKVGDDVKIPQGNKYTGKKMRVESMDVRAGTFGGFYLYLYGPLVKFDGTLSNKRSSIRGVIV
mgnify:CR=1 FL=1